MSGGGTGRIRLEAQHWPYLGQTATERLLV
jgi:hypothetical protein